MASPAWTAQVAMGGTASTLGSRGGQRDLRTPIHGKKKRLPGYPENKPRRTLTAFLRDLIPLCVPSS